MTCAGLVATLRPLAVPLRTAEETGVAAATRAEPVDVVVTVADGCMLSGFRLEG